MSQKRIDVSRIAKTAIFSALSFVLYMYAKFPLPIFPFFLELHFSQVPALIASFLLGPLDAAIVIAVKILLKLPFSATVYVGEMSDLFIGLAFVVPPGIIYKRKRTLKGALAGLVAGSALSILMAVFFNIYVAIPFYVELFFGGDFDEIISTCRPFAPGLNRENFKMLYSLYIALPFNLLRCAVTGIITFLLHKRISKIFSKF